MANYSMKHVVTLIIWSLATPLFPLAWGADNLSSFRFGEKALAYSSGSIQQSTPQDGFVNVITGDNQTIGDHMILGSRDIIYLRLNQPSDVALGDLFTIYRRTHKVFHPTTGQYLGYLVNRLAVVEVSQIDSELTTVRVIRTYAAISPGDPVMRFVLPTVEEAAADKPSAGNITEGRVVDFQSNMGTMNLVAQRNVVYLDRGRVDGIRPGDRMEVIRTGGNLPQRVVGELKILSIEDRTATALVTRSSSRILKGDRFSRLAAPAAEVIPISQTPQQSLTVSPTEAPPPSKFHIQNAAGETRISLSDFMKQIRFESGEATIKSEGYQVLDQLIAHLKTAAGDQWIRVEGHADNMEIGPSLQSLYQTNWDLSKARARAVLRYLNEKGGIDSVKLSSVGYGDTKPIASNATEVGRQQNRRVDIVLSPPESPAEKSGPSAKSAETGNNGSILSRLSQTEGSTSISATNTATTAGSADPSLVAPSSVPGNPPSTPMPPSVVRGSSDEKSDASVAPLQ